MQTTLRLDDQVYRHAKAEAARLGVTVTKYIEDSLLLRIAGGGSAQSKRDDEISERNRLMEELLHATAHFRVGPRPTREEMNER